MLTPLIKGLNTIFPKSFIDVLVIPQTADVLKNNPYINQIFTFDKRDNKMFTFFKTVLLLRKQKYDYAILPHSSLTTILMAKFAGIKKRIGFDRWMASKFLTIKVPFRNNIHRIEKNLDLLSCFTPNNFAIQTDLFPSEEETSFAKNILKKLNLNDRPLIAIAPGSVWNTKRWGKENYIQLTTQLVRNGFNIIFIGSKSEIPLCEEIVKRAGAPEVTNLAGQTTILESAAIIQKCNLMICNDSGALHIANAVKTDVYAFFGPTVKNIGYFPFRTNDFIFEKKLACRPCGSHGGEKCPQGHHNCMRLLEPEFVYNKITKYFDN